MATSPIDQNTLLQIAQQKAQQTNPALMPSPNPVLNQIRQQPQRPTGPAQIQHPESFAPQPITPPPSAAQQRLTQLTTHKPALENVYGDITQSRLGQAHPVLGKILGGLAQVPATVADIGLNVAPMGIGKLVPGSSANQAAKVQNNMGLIKQEQANAKNAADIQHLGAESGHIQEQTREMPEEAAAREEQERAAAGNLRSETNIREHPLPLYKEADKVLGPNGEPVNFEEHTGQYSLGNLTGLTPSRAGAGDKLQHVTFTNGTSGTFDPLAKPGENYRDSAGNVVTNPKLYEPPQGQWIVNPVDPNNPAAGGTLLRAGAGAHVAPGAITPGGMNTENVAAHKDVQGMSTDLNYANAYLQMPQHTGPGDEGLMEKFFDMAKPSSGFRMSQPQINMLNGARSWMGSLEAHLRHATVGTWFSDEQRKQIVDTMNQIGQAKQGAIEHPGLNEETREYQGHTYKKGADGQWHLQQKP